MPVPLSGMGTIRSELSARGSMVGLVAQRMLERES